jgi:HD-GYP domain-containing protein (c-di-GMP phosphodiesterase class II)
LGYDSQEELFKTHIHDLYVNPKDRQNLVNKFQAGDVVRNAEIGLKRKDGTPLIALDNAHAVRSEQGEVIYFEGTLTDITALKQAEAILERQADELRQRYAELTLLYEAGLTINRELDPHLQLETLFKTAMQALQADHAEFSRYDAAKGIVQFELGIGYSPEILKKLHPLSAHDGEVQGLIGLVARNRQPLNLPDVHADPRYIEIDPSIRSGLWVPVARENQLLGVLGVLSTRLDAFNEQHERLLSLFANQAAIALENARLFAETGRRLKNVQALRTIDMAIGSSLDLQVTFDIFLEQVTQQLGVHAVDILKFDPHLQTLEYASGRGFRNTAIQKSHFQLGEGLPGKIALEQRIRHIPDLTTEQEGVVRTFQFEDEGFKTYFGVPLVAKGQVKGVLEIFHRGSLATDPDWIDFLGVLAGQAAIAIDNITLFIDLQRSNLELMLAYDATIEGWSHALDLRDRETEGHTQRVVSLTQHLARQLGVSDHELVHIRRGALLHDIGKMGIPDEILRKTASLNEQEWAVMYQHPLYAYDMLLPISYLRPAMDIPYCHHEKWDGSGYPRGLKGEQIPLAARLFAVVDVFDALTSDRPYRKAWPRKKALEYIQQQAGKHFDPEIVSAFLGMPALIESWNGDKISQT